MLCKVFVSLIVTFLNITLMRLFKMIQLKFLESTPEEVVNFKALFDTKLSGMLRFRNGELKKI